LTINVAEKSSDGDTAAVQIESGGYAFALSGLNSGASIEMHLNIGQEDSVIFKTYTEDSYDIVWLPDCTMFLRATGAIAYSSAVVAFPDNFFD